MIIGIVAVDRNLAIGKDGRLPWRYSADMMFFMEQTTGNAVVMGRRTWLSLPKPLSNRLNIILSRQLQIEPQDSLVVMRDVESVLSLNNQASRHLFVIGGARVYESFLPHIERWVVTEVPLSVEGSDAFMPAGFLEGFELYEVRQLEEDLKVKFYERKNQRSENRGQTSEGVL